MAELPSSGAIRSFASRYLPLVSILSFLSITALFRSSENALGTTFAPIGHSALNLNPSVIGLAVTLTGLTMVLGNLAVLISPKPVKLSAVLMLALASLATSITAVAAERSVPLYFAAAALFGISIGLAVPTLAALAGRLRGVSSERSLTAFTVAMSASVAVGPLLESSVLNLNGNSLGSALAVFIPFPLLAIVLLPAVKLREGTKIAIGGPPAWKPLVRDRVLRLAIIAQSINEIAIITVISFGTLVARFLYDATPAQAQLSFTIFFAMAFLVRMLLLWRLPNRRAGFMLNLALLLVLAGLLALSSSDSLLFFYAVMALIGIANGLFFPISLSLASAGAKPPEATKMIAALFLAINTVSVIYPFMFGTAIAEIGYRKSLVCAFGVEAVLGIALLHSKRSGTENLRKIRSAT